MTWRKKEPLHLRLNPCDIARFDCLAPLGDLAAKLVPDCPCCAGFRVIAAFVAGLGIGAWLL